MSEYVNDINAEMCVVGTLLVNNDFLLKSDILQPRHFYYKELATIYYAMRKLVDEKVLEFDDLSISNVIEQSKGMKKHIDNAGIKDIFEYIEDLKVLARNDFNEYYTLMKRVMTLSFKRKAKDKLQALVNECNSDNEDDINKFNYKMQSDVSDIANEYMFDDDIPLMGEVIDNVWERIKSRRSGDGIIGIPSKYPSVNKYYTYRKGELVVIGGMAKKGKSVYVSNETLFMLKNGVKVAIFDTELTDEIWLPRFLAQITDLTIKQVETGDYTNDDENTINEALEWIKSGTLTHLYDPEWTMDKIYTKAKKIKLKYGLDVLIYDYIKADDVDFVSMGLQEHSYLGKLTSFLKNKVGGELDLAVIAPAQMDDNEMRLSNSRKIQRYASTIVYWMEKDMDMIVRDGNEEGTNYLFVDYNRNGGHHKRDGKGKPVEYINFVMDGDRAKISMAKTRYHSKDGSLPY